MVIGTINNSQFHRRFMLVLSCPGIPQFTSCYLTLIMSTFIVEWRRDVYYCTAFSFLAYNFDVWSVMSLILMLFCIGTFKPSSFEPGSFSLTRSPVILFNLFPDGWMIYPVNKVLGCVCSCAQFFSPLLKLLSYSVQEILTSAEERSRFHVKNWQEIEAPWFWKNI